MVKPWPEFRAIIVRLYIHEGRTLKDVQHIMDTKYNFRASIRAYRQHFDTWDAVKYNCRARNLRRKKKEEARETRKVPLPSLKSQLPLESQYRLSDSPHASLARGISFTSHNSSSQTSYSQSSYSQTSYSQPSYYAPSSYCQSPPEYSPPAFSPPALSSASSIKSEAASPPMITSPRVASSYFEAPSTGHFAGRTKSSDGPGWPQPDLQSVLRSPLSSPEATPLYLGQLTNKYPERHQFNSFPVGPTTQPRLLSNVGEYHYESPWSRSATYPPGSLDPVLNRAPYVDNTPRYFPSWQTPRPLNQAFSFQQPLPSPGIPKLRTQNSIHIKAEEADHDSDLSLMRQP